MQRRHSQILQINEGISIHASVHGNTIINAGDIVTISIPRHAEVKTENSDEDDRFLQGKFLLKRVRHEFKIQGFVHTIALTCVKDSTPDELESNPAVFEEKPLSGAALVEDFYSNITTR